MNPAECKLAAAIHRVLVGIIESPNIPMPVGPVDYDEGDHPNWFTLEREGKVYKITVEEQE